MTNGRRQGGSGICPPTGSTASKRPWTGNAVAMDSTCHRPPYTLSPAMSSPAAGSSARVRGLPVGFAAAAVPTMYKAHDGSAARPWACYQFQRPNVPSATLQYNMSAWKLNAGTSARPALTRRFNRGRDPGPGRAPGSRVSSSSTRSGLVRAIGITKGGCPSRYRVPGHRSDQCSAAICANPGARHLPALEAPSTQIRQDEIVDSRSRPPSSSNPARPVAQGPRQFAATNRAGPPRGHFKTGRAAQVSDQSSARSSQRGWPTQHASRAPRPLQAPDSPAAGLIPGGPDRTDEGGTPSEQAARPLQGAG